MQIDTGEIAKLIGEKEMTIRALQLEVASLKEKLDELNQDPSPSDQE